MKHTKEPWAVRQFFSNCYHIWNGERAVAEIYLPFYSEYSEEEIANAHRIVNCINACANMEDPETEIEKLRADKDELLEAYKESIGYLVHIGGADPKYLYKCRKLMRRMGSEI